MIVRPETESCTDVDPTKTRRTAGDFHCCLAGVVDRRPNQSCTMLSCLFTLHSGRQGKDKPLLLGPWFSRVDRTKPEERSSKETRGIAVTNGAARAGSPTGAPIQLSRSLAVTPHFCDPPREKDPTEAGAVILLTSPESIGSTDA